MSAVVPGLDLRTKSSSEHLGSTEEPFGPPTPYSILQFVFNSAVYVKYTQPVSIESQEC